MITVSIQVSAYKNDSELSTMLTGIISQQTDFKCEVNICDNGTIENVNAILQLYKTKNNAMVFNTYSPADDILGLKQAHGEFLAFCCYNDYWADPLKIKKQVNFLKEHYQYLACVHDIELVNEYDVSLSYAIQKSYKSQFYSDNKIFSQELVQKNIYPGALSTMVCRNIFDRNPSIDYLNNSLLPIFWLFSTLAFEGDIYNFYNQQMVQRRHIGNTNVNETKELQFHDFESIIYKQASYEQFSNYTYRQYNKILDNRYLNLLLAAKAFELYKNKDRTDKSLALFAALYDNAFDPQYNLPTNQQLSFELKKMFDSLRYKIFEYQIQHGSHKELVLLKYMNLLNDNMCIEYILRTYTHLNRNNKLVRHLIYQQCQEPDKVKKQVANRIITAPFRKTKKAILNYAKKGHVVFKKFITRSMRKKGFSAYMANEWYDSVRINLFQDKTSSIREKIWCYKRGFMPWRIFQYELTNDNYPTYLSDRDYMYLHQINNNYKKWIEDKMTFRYVLEPFKEYLPKYYFHIIRREGYTVLLPLMDCPDGYEATFDDLFRLLRAQGALALKAASGTHGIGFYKMSYETGTYFMNNEESSEYEITKIIKNFTSYYVVTEYIVMHDQIKHIYAGSVNTLRIMMINRSGLNPRLLDAYMRIGSSTTGTTDNVAYGGVFCKIDIKNGRYGQAQQSKEHVLISCPNHPDTNIPIEGIIPHWETIKYKLIEISLYMGQLEYLGFDVVCTPKSFTILEINSHQDLHKYKYYDDNIKQFYFDKLNQKRKAYATYKKG